MPGKVGVKIKAGRNLPIMDKSSDTTDAYVEIKLGNVTHKTDVCRKSLNPVWNSDWFRFELDDAELQDEILQIRLMDYDTYSANDAIGKVNIGLNPLCLETSGQISGWIPVFDTMHGIRGEVHVIVKVDLFSDVNKFRQSSCGIPFFHSPCIPNGYRAQVIHGFVEELVVNDDPEYQWIDKIRTPRASNEARQLVFQKLSGQVQRKMGLKAINMGANAVIAYTQCFDLEGDVGVVARGVGTAVSLIKDTTNQPTSADSALIEERTLKYLEFLRGGNFVTRPPQSCSTPSLNRLNFENYTLGVDEITDSESEFGSNVMLDLIKQEEGRGDRPLKKFTYKMLNITNSSRNVFNDKCATLMRKIDENSSSSGSRSLSSAGIYFPGKNLKIRSESNSMLDVRKISPRNRWTINRYMREEDNLQEHHKGLQRTMHPIVRSVSDDSAMKQTSSCAAKRNQHEIKNSFCIESESALNSLQTQQYCMCKAKQEDCLATIDSEVSDENERTATNNDEIENDFDLSPSTSITIENVDGDDGHACCPKRFSISQTDLVNFKNNPNYNPIIHSQSFSNVNASSTALTASASNRPYSRPASITLVTTTFSNSTYPNPQLRLCPSTPTPSESHEVVIEEQNSKSASDIFTFPTVSGGVGNPLYPPGFVSTDSKLLSPTNLDSNFVAVPPNTNRCCTSTNSNAKNSLLVVPFISNAGFTITNTKNHRQHRSLSEITGSNNHSNNGSPHLKAGGHVSPGVAMHADEDISAAKPTASSATINPALAKLTPSPTRSGVTSATPASIQSQSDSLSSATTISTATTIIPKEIGEMCRRSSDSDLSVTPKVIQRKRNSFCVTSDRLMAATAMMRLGQPTVGGKNATAEGLDMLEYPFLTMTKYPAGLILHIGATVAARSVKLLERVPNPDEPEIRDSWWTELRMEIRSHARSLGCNVVLGYSESTTISDDVCVLSATGTAAIINMGYNRSVSQSDIFNIAKSTGVNAMSASLEERMAGNNEGSIKDSVGISNGSVGKKYGLSSLMMVTKTSCTICHVPYNASSIPFSVKMRKCAICCKGRVPDVLLATLEVPDCVQVTGRGCFLQAQVVRAKKDLRSELNAKEISDGLPFLEYELHRVLINKLKAKGMNAIFGLRVQVSIGERMLALVATGTALFITALPVPQVPKIVAGNSWTDKQKLNELQKKLQETFERYQDVYQLRPLDHDMLDKSSDTDDSDEEGVDIDLNCGNKDTCVLEVDDIEDLEIISLLMEQQPPEGFHVVSTEKVPGMVDMEAVKNLQMFTQVWRAKADGGQSVSGFPKHFQRLLQTIYFKLRTMIPCAICDLRFKLDFPESDQIQILVTGMALGLGDPSKSKYKRKMQANGQLDSNNTDNHHHSNDGHKKATSDEDYIFPLDEDQMVETPTPATNMPLFGAQLFKNRKSSPIQLTTAPGLIRQRYNRLCERNGVDITPMSFIPGGRIEKYLGNLNFFFIRESTSVRENGGISGFVHGFITELLAVVRAHIASLGGNAMVSYYINELILYDNQHKNQGQCLISIGGDAVYVSYHNDD
ncbi:C2 domain-containing protein 5 isoform X1 [Stomoxys calcitrans]|uniref:C2 domain-containing protein 5 isoform X1 n=1 Tax=Stomoxys calcitrans TaxID=35570 RepID=UPI0027E24F86|nr:C2 domain-containing protein 5 isoform X1 [Stomoxys calcitrans]